MCFLLFFPYCFPTFHQRESSGSIPALPVGSFLLLIHYRSVFCVAENTSSLKPMTESSSESHNVLGLLHFIPPFLLQHILRESFSQSSSSLRLDETMQCLLGNLQEAHPIVPGKYDGHFFPGSEQLQFQGNWDDRHRQGTLESNGKNKDNFSWSYD